MLRPVRSYILGIFWYFLGPDMKNNHIKLVCISYVPFSTLSMSEFRGYEKFLFGVITVSIFVSYHLSYHGRKCSSGQNLNV